MKMLLAALLAVSALVPATTAVTIDTSNLDLNSVIALLQDIQTREEDLARREKEFEERTSRRRLNEDGFSSAAKDQCLVSNVSSCLDECQQSRLDVATFYRAFAPCPEGAYRSSEGLPEDHVCECMNGWDTIEEITFDNDSRTWVGLCEGSPTPEPTSMPTDPPQVDDPVVAYSNSIGWNFHVEAEWVDHENGCGNQIPTGNYDMWGSCAGLDRIGISAVFSSDPNNFDWNGSVVGWSIWDGMSGNWGGSFSNKGAYHAEGFLNQNGCGDSGGGIHILANDSFIAAWGGCSMTYSGNFDISNEGQNCSDFRADSGGWGNVRFRLYC